MSIEITYFVHSTTVDNEVDVVTGWRHGELSKTGIAQAVDLGRLVGAKEFDLIVSSDLQRALDTAKICFGENADIIADPRLRELDFGLLTGSPALEVLETATGYLDHPYPEGESYLDVERRISDFLQDLRNCSDDGDRVAIMSHKAPQFALEVLLNNRTWSQAIDEDWRKTKSWQPGWIYTT